MMSLNPQAGQGRSRPSMMMSRDVDIIKTLTQWYHIGERQEAFSLPPPRLKALRAAIQQSMSHGLLKHTSNELHQQEGLAMTPSCITQLAQQQTHGVAYGLDMGGTNLRVLRAQFSVGGKPDVVARTFKISSDLATGTGKALFEFLAGRVRECKREFGDEGMTNVPLGFCFSFPSKYVRADSAVLRFWTKEFSATGVVGEDVVTLLQEALDGIDAGVRVRACVNDTVGVLAAGRGMDTRCEVGLIFGTGTNAAYIEKNFGGCGSSMWICTEWGAFGNRSEERCVMPITDADTLLDQTTTNPGCMLLSKMVGGRFLDALVTILYNSYVDFVLREEEGMPQPASSSTSAAAAGRVTTPTAAGPHRTTASMRKIQDGKITPEIISSVLQCDGSHTELRSLMPEGLLEGGPTAHEAMALSSICEMICKRASRMAGAALAALLHVVHGESLSGMVSVAVDGSVFRNMPGFRAGLMRALQELLGADQASRVVLQDVADGSGLGAAALACAIHNDMSGQEPVG